MSSSSHDSNKPETESNASSKLSGQEEDKTITKASVAPQDQLENASIPHTEKVAVTEVAHDAGQTLEEQDAIAKVGEKNEKTDTSEEAVNVSTSHNMADRLSGKAAGLAISIPSPAKSTASHFEKRRESSPPPPPPPKDSKYIMPKSPGADGDSTELDEKYALKKEDEEEMEAKSLEKPPNPGAEEDDAMDDSQSEIQSIMEQFDEGMGGPNADEIMSPRMEIAGPMLGSPVIGHPPRKSSLEPLRSASQISLSQESSPHHSQASLPPRSSSLALKSPVLSQPEQTSANDASEVSLNRQISRQSLPLLPQPDLEPDLPFDFHRFLEQLRHRTADPVAKFLRSFLFEFGKKQWMVHEQVKIISDFLSFIAKRMAQCEVWVTVSDAEFDNAREGMEKLVMNRLYTQTFSPAIPPPNPIASLPKGKRRGQQLPPPPGRRGQHQEDVERDEVLAQKVRIYGWVREEHLDIKPIGEKGKRFLHLAQQELLKIGNYRAPRDKVICVLNSCKVIFGFLRNAQHDQSADSFVPLLIYTVLRANPPHLVSNVQYILRFRNQEKLTGEAGYYVSSLGGAIEFIERLDRTSLTISDDDFEKNVEAAVSAIAEGHPDGPAHANINHNNNLPPPVPEKSSANRTETTLRSSLDVDQPTHSRNNSKSYEDENAAVAGLLKSIQRPLSTIGRIFTDDSASTSQPQTQPPLTPKMNPLQRLSPLPTADLSGTSPKRGQDATDSSQGVAEDAAARQASKEAEEARRIRAREESHVVETLCGMFPALDRDIVIDVVRANEGRIGSAVDACLALSSS